jgi:hypothetical protein
MTKESSFVNHLVDLAGSYTRYRLVASPTNSNFYLDNLWSSSNSEQNTALMTNYWQQMGEGNSDSGASQSTFQFLYSLEFAQSGNKKGQILAKTVRNGFSNYGKFQTIPRGGNDDPTIRAKDIKNVGARYANIQGSLFAYGSNDSIEIAYNDSRQGDLGDCYLMAAMAAVAVYRPQVIRSMFHDNGNGTYDVTFFDPLSLSLNNPYKTVTVDADLPIWDGNNINNGPQLLYGHSGDKTTSGYELWSSLLEKAYALAFGGKSYAGIEQNAAALAISRILGVDSFLYPLDGIDGIGSFLGDPLNEVIKTAIVSFGGAGSLSEDQLLQLIKLFISEGIPLAMNTKPTLPQSLLNSNIYANHVYVPMAVDSAKKEITFYNPHGKIEKYSLSVVRQSFAYLHFATR